MDRACKRPSRRSRSPGNSFGEAGAAAGAGPTELDFEVKDARKSRSTSCGSSATTPRFDPRSQHVTRAIARLLHGAGVDFGILYDGERNAGNDVRRVGEEGLFEMLAEQNVATLSACSFKRIITSDPHSLNTLAQRVPRARRRLDGPASHRRCCSSCSNRAGWRWRTGSATGSPTTTPATSGRLNGGYDAPRAILELLGCELVEMPRNRDNCVLLRRRRRPHLDRRRLGLERPSENRIHEAVELGRTSTSSSSPVPRT